MGFQDHKNSMKRISNKQANLKNFELKMTTTKLKIFTFYLFILLLYVTTLWTHWKRIRHALFSRTMISLVHEQLHFFTYINDAQRMVELIVDW